MGGPREEKSVGIGREHMASFKEAFRQGREQARAARGAPPLSRNEWDAPGSGEAAADDGTHAAGSAAFEEALRQRDEELAETKQLLAEMADYAEKMEARVIELIASSEPMARVLLLPGVKTYLLQRFHPDKYPDADAKQRELLTNALKTINTAYAKAGELRTPNDGEDTSPA
jgi:hypothetical protein